MLLERSTHPQFVSNTYLLADGHGGPAVFVDAGGPVAPLIEAAERQGLMPTHVLLTHHHHDHVCDAAALRERWPSLEVLIGEAERQLLEDAGGSEVPVTGLLQPGETLGFGALSVRPLPTPGHTAGMLSLVVEESPGAGPAAVFTGDTLFKGSVGGVRAPGHTTIADLRHSIMDELMALPPQTVIHPGHAEDSTVAAEWEHNPFIRVWRGLDPEGHEQCTALEEPATLILIAPDYDGGTKAWVRWKDGSDDIVPGSRVERET